MAPFAAVFFLLMLFLFLASAIYTPGVALQLPVADDVPGMDKPSVHVAVDANGTYFFRNQMISEAELSRQLEKEVRSSPRPLMLVLHADQAVTHSQLVRVTMLARDVGIAGAWLATLPKATDGPQMSRP